MNKVIYTNTKGEAKKAWAIKCFSKSSPSLKPYWLIITEELTFSKLYGEVGEEIQVDKYDASQKVKFELIPKQKAEFVMWGEDFKNEDNPDNDGLIYGIAYLDDEGTDIQDYVWFKTKAERFASMVEDCLEIVNCNPYQIEVGDKVMGVLIWFTAQQIFYQFVATQTEKGLEGSFTICGDKNTLRNNTAIFNRGDQYKIDLSEHDGCHLILPYSDDISYLPIFNILK